MEDEIIRQILKSHYAQKYGEEVDKVDIYFRSGLSPSDLSKVSGGYRSWVKKIPLEYIVRRKDKEEDAHQNTFILKRYESTVQDSTGSYPIGERLMKEPEITRCLFEEAEGRLHLMYPPHESENYISFLADYVEGKDIGDNFQTLPFLDKQVLRIIAKDPHQMLPRSELIERMDEEENYTKNYREADLLCSLENLEYLGFISLKGEGETAPIFLTAKFDKVFYVSNGDIKEKADYQSYRRDIFLEGNETIFKIQEAAQKTNLVSKLGIVPFKASDFTQRFLIKFDASVRLLSSLGEDDLCAAYTNRDREKIRKIFSEEISGPLESIVAAGDFIIGEAYPKNFVVTPEEKVVVIDISHATKGHWLSDFINFLDFGHLFCGLQKEVYDSLLALAINEGKNRFPDSEKSGMDLETIQRNLRLYETVRYLGAACGQLTYDLYQKRLRDSGIRELNYRAYKRTQFLKNLLDEFPKNEKFKEFKDLLSPYLVLDSLLKPKKNEPLNSDKKTGSIEKNEG